MVDFDGTETGGAPGSHPLSDIEPNSQEDFSPAQDDSQQPLDVQAHPSNSEDIFLDSDSDGDEDQLDPPASDTSRGSRVQHSANPVQPRKWLSGTQLSIPFSDTPTYEAPVNKYFSVKFPWPRDGATTTEPHLPYEGYTRDLSAENGIQNEWAPFSSRIEWELARWVKFRGLSAGAFSELLKIDGVSQLFALHLYPSNTLKLVDALGLSFSSSEELNRIIDKKIPNGLPQFVREEVELDGHKYEFYHRDIIQCIRALYGDPELADFLVHAPEKWYTGPDKKVRIYSEMHTGHWWWTRQVSSLADCHHVVEI